MSAEQQNGSTPWFREAMVWLLIVIPASAFIAGLITLVLAYRYPDPEIPHTDQAASQQAR
jgi:hypothetical protein